MFNGIANEAPDLVIEEFPTLNFYPKNNKQGTKYDGGFEVDDFKKWLGENSSAY